MVSIYAAIIPAIMKLTPAYAEALILTCYPTRWAQYEAGSNSNTLGTMCHKYGVRTMLIEAVIDEVVQYNWLKAPCWLTFVENVAFTVMT